MVWYVTVYLMVCIAYTYNNRYISTYTIYGHMRSQVTPLGPRGPAEAPCRSHFAASGRHRGHRAATPKTGHIPRRQRRNIMDNHGL